MSNCNCFENENTTDKINTNGLQRLNGNENITVFENKIKHIMKKQTIKLNESQLRQMIKEALNELDWKTYANAGQKDAERQSAEYNQRKSRGEKLSPEEIVGMFKRPMKFRSAAIDALNKKYKEGNEDGYDFFATQHGSPLNGKAKYYANVENRTGEGYGYASSTEDGKTFKSQPLTRQTRLKNKGREITVSPERIFGHPNHDKVKKLKDFASEVGNYNQGNYDYSTEKGWHLKESQLRNIIKESIKKVLRESAGHLYFHDEEGRPYTNSKETWRGVPGTTYIYHGEWADPEVWYEGYEINYNDLEDFMFDIYNSECTEDGIEATEEGYESWMEKQGTSWIKATLDEYISNINLPS